MSKQKSIIVVLISLAFIMSFFTNCDKDKSPVKPDEGSIVGDWKLTKITIETANETTILTEDLLNLIGAYWTLKIKSDNTFESNYNLESGPEIETGTWSISGNKLTITFASGGSETFEFSLDGNTLILKWTDTEDGVEEKITAEFTRQ